MTDPFTTESDEDSDPEEQPAEETAAVLAPRNYITPAGLQRLRAELRFCDQGTAGGDRGGRLGGGEWGSERERRLPGTGKKRLREIDRRIRFLRKRVDAAEIVDPEAPRSGRAATHVFFGATVRYENGAGTERVVRIVGADEIDLDRHYISWLSPLARALMKSGPGDSVILRAPGGSEELQILEVRYERIPINPFAEPPGAQAAGRE